MFQNFRDYLSQKNLLNKPVVFLCGVLVGASFTFIDLENLSLPKAFFKKSPNAESTKTADLNAFEDFDIPMNERVQQRINFYLRPGWKEDLVQCYQRSGQYLSMMQAIFEEYNLPHVFIFLPILESRFIPHSRSRAGAVGLWQIMPSTASEYGLKYNRWIDERRDPEKSTIVAAEYLRFLYDKFGNWDTALAAYNYGHSKLTRALRREKVSNYWDLRRIPKETYNFVSNFYAILHLLSKPAKYGLKLPELHAPVEYETIEVEATFPITEIARLADISPKTIKNYNPAFTSNIAPVGKYPIKVPLGVKEHFLEQYKENPPNRVEITYTGYEVKRGDNLYKIARNYGTTVSGIMADNNLRSARWIYPGMKLKIASVTVIRESEKEAAVGKSSLVEEENKIKFLYRAERDAMGLTTIARYYAVNVKDLKSWNPWVQKNRLEEGEELIIYKPTEKVTFHRTRRGDSLWELARRYGTTVSNLKRWNQLQSSRIYPGTNLIVKLSV